MRLTEREEKGHRHTDKLIKEEETERAADITRQSKIVRERERGGKRERESATTSQEKKRNKTVHLN